MSLKFLKERLNSEEDMNAVCGLWSTPSSAKSANSNSTAQQLNLTRSQSPPPKRLSSRSSSSSFLERVLTRRRSSSQAVFDAKGSLGLNLLHCPSDPHLDFIFVHGLAGGSSKTWCLDDDPTLFWPKAWLPREPAFRNVRIHSYGYDADWTSTKVTHTLNIHDFGRQFLERLRTSDCLSSSNPVGDCY